MRFALVLAFLFTASGVFAQVEQINATAPAGNCALCFKTAEVMLGQLPSVREAKSDPATKKITVSFKPGQAVPIHDILDRIRVAAPNTPIDIDFTAVGKVLTREGQFILSVAQQNDTFLIEGNRQQALTNFVQNQHQVRVGGLLTEIHGGYKIQLQRLQKAD